MKTRRATELSNRSGEILEQALQEPVLITKGRNERPAAVIISFDLYNQLNESKPTAEHRQVDNNVVKDEHK